MTVGELRKASVGYPMLKIQQRGGSGWANCSRVAGEKEAGLRVLESYRRNWPSGQYRLVRADAFEGDRQERYTVLS